MANLGLFGVALQAATKALSATNWIDALKTDAGIVNAGLVRAKVVRGTNQSIPDTTLTAISWSGVEYDSPGGSWSGGSGTRLVIPYDGVYRVGLAARFAANATGLRSATLKKNAATELWTASRIGLSVVSTELAFSGDFSLAAGDYLECLLAQTSGGALNAETPFNFLSYCKVG